MGRSRRGGAWEAEGAARAAGPFAVPAPRAGHAGFRGPANRDRAGRAGFTLIEVTLTLVIVSLLAVLSLPRSSPSPGSTSLRIKAYEIAALLRTDRSAALRVGRPVTTIVDFDSRQVRSGVSSGTVPIPEGFEIRVSAFLADGVRFAPDGTASGGEIYLRQAGAAGAIVAIRIDGLTAAIDVDRGGRHDG